MQTNVSDLAVLVVDDEKNIRSTLSACLEALGCHVGAAGNAQEALAALGRRSYDLAFVDLRLAEDSGLDLLPRLLAASPRLDVVIITAYATIQTAVEAIARGARDVLPKPFSPAQIRQMVERVSSLRALELRVSDLQSQLELATPEIDLETASSRMRALLDVLPKAAVHDVAVLLEGESGTGKSVLARRIHAMSARKTRPFVVVNCPTLSEELLASELFGHAKGAFTGAVRDQAGRVEAAEGGTLFLDEIAEIPPSLQAKLLRFLQDKQFERVGENKTRTADVRVVAATNRNLDDEVRAGHFREDLLYRLNTFQLTVPPLRERREDILPLTRRFIASFARLQARSVPELTPEAEAVISGYAWPGNIRELRNAVERAVILCPANRIAKELLPERMVARAATAPWVGGDFTVEEVEREHMLRVLARTEALDDAARILGIDPSTLWRKRKRYEES